MSGYPWSEADDAVLIKLYDTHPAAHIAARVGRPVLGVYSRAERLRKAGRFPSAHRTRWPADGLHQIIDMLDSGLSVKVAARRLRRKPQALQSLLSEHQISAEARLRHASGMSTADVVRELGIGRNTVSKYIRTGLLNATRRLVVRRTVYTVAQEDVRAFIATHGGYIPLKPDADWAPLVEDARRVFAQRYISRVDLAALLCVCREALIRREDEQGFPAPALRLGHPYGGDHYERAAVWAWLAEHPEHLTRAAREELGR